MRSLHYLSLKFWLFIFVKNLKVFSHVWRIIFGKITQWLLQSCVFVRLSPCEVQNKQNKFLVNFSSLKFGFMSPKSIKHLCNINLLCFLEKPGLNSLFDVSSIWQYHHNIKINITNNSHFAFVYLLGKLDYSLYRQQDNNRLHKCLLCFLF